MTTLAISGHYIKQHFPLRSKLGIRVGLFTILDAQFQNVLRKVKFCPKEPKSQGTQILSQRFGDVNSKKI